MSALQQFARNIDASFKLVGMYRELRGFRNLGARGLLDAQNQDLLWLPRSAVVAAVSALDTYVHGVVKDRLPHLFGGNKIVPESLAKQLALIIPVKDANSFRKAVPLLLAHDTVGHLLKRLEEGFLQFQSFQAPDKIIDGYCLIGIDNVFERVADLWPGPNTTSDDLKRRLAGFVRRRNQIAHEGDIEANGNQRPMQPDYAIECREFLTSLVNRLDQVAYAAYVCI